MTFIKLSDGILHINTITTERLTCPLSLDSLASIIGLDDPARVILFARHGSCMPAHIRGVMRCGI